MAESKIEEVVKVPTTLEFAQKDSASKVEIGQWLMNLLTHLDGFGVELQDLTIVDGRIISVTFSGPIPKDHIEHLGLSELI